MKHFALPWSRKASLIERLDWKVEGGASWALIAALAALTLIGYLSTWS
jgi:hypothetical protein